MAEVAQRRYESMAREIEDMHRVKLYTEEEARQLLLKRKHLEYKLQGEPENLQSFTDYINFEETLLKDVALRRSNKGIEEKKDGIERKIMNRIRALYETSLDRFQCNINMFMSFLKFCSRADFVQPASVIVLRMVQKHSDNPQLWRVAANWHGYDRKDIKTALSTLYKGIALHRNCPTLYKDLILLELHEYEKHKGVVKDPDQERLCAYKLEKIMITVFENIRDWSTYTDLLKLLEKYDFTYKVQGMILKRLLTHHSNNEQVWDLVAQREMKDFYQRPRNLNSTLVEDSEVSPTTPLEACIAKYREGLSAIPPPRKESLWALYIDFLLKLYEESQEEKTGVVYDALKMAFKHAAREGRLSERHYIEWLRVAPENIVMKIAERGTDAIPLSVDLWKMRLNLQIEKNDDTYEVHKIFSVGIAILKEKSLPLWSIILQYHCQRSNNAEIHSVYMDAIKQPSEISDTFKPQFLEWLNLTKGIAETRIAYAELVQLRPYCRALHKTMLQLESMQEEVNFPARKRIYHLSCEQFGTENVDVWIDYILFCMQYSSYLTDVNESVERIRRQAQETIPLHLQPVFENKYNIITEMA